MIDPSRSTSTTYTCAADRCDAEVPTPLTWCIQHSSHPGHVYGGGPHRILRFAEPDTLVQQVAPTPIKSKTQGLLGQFSTNAAGFDASGIDTLSIDASGIGAVSIDASGIGAVSAHDMSIDAATELLRGPSERCTHVHVDAGSRGFVQLRAVDLSGLAEPPDLMGSRAGVGASIGCHHVCEDHHLVRRDQPFTALGYATELSVHPVKSTLDPHLSIRAATHDWDDWHDVATQEQDATTVALARSWPSLLEQPMTAPSGLDDWATGRGRLDAFVDTDALTSQADARFPLASPLASAVVSPLTSDSTRHARAGDAEPLDQPATVQDSSGGDQPLAPLARPWLSAVVVMGLAVCISVLVLAIVAAIEHPQLALTLVGVGVAASIASGVWAYRRVASSTRPQRG